MEKRVKRPTGLTVLFWRYLLTAGIAAAAAALVWWAVLTLLFRTGLILPAAYAAGHAAETAEMLTEDFSPEKIPHYYRWAVFDASGDTADPGNTVGRYLEYARQSLLQGGTSARSFPYTQYHYLFPLEDGGICVLQYDYSIPYVSPELQKILPDFQLCAMAVLLGLWLLLSGLCTRHYTRLLREDARAIGSATRAIAGQQLNESFTGTTNVRELGEALEAMDLLRRNLAESLEHQWAMEQQRQLELSALAHDLKTPLAIVSGNSELLAEEELTEAQRVCVCAILRGAERMGNYVDRLRTLSSGDGGAEELACVSFADLFAAWQAAGEDLCGPKGVCFSAPEPPVLTLAVRRETMSRAVLNLLDNAARYAGEGGGVVLEARVEDGLLTVRVTDTGPGFSAEALARAGHGLYTSAASRPQGGHTGWGLCYARQAARDHGGGLRLSNAEHGAAAEIYWPV